MNCDDPDARTSRPDLFALADDLLEAEMIRTGSLTFDKPVSEVLIPAA